MVRFLQAGVYLLMFGLIVVMGSLVNSVGGSAARGVSPELLVSPGLLVGYTLLAVGGILVVVRFVRGGTDQEEGLGYYLLALGSWIRGLGSDLLDFIGGLIIWLIIVGLIIGVAVILFALSG